MVKRLRRLTLKEWAYAGLAAAINSGVGGIALVIVDPQDFNLFSMSGAMKLAKVCAALSLVGFAMWARQNPLQVPVAVEEEDDTPLGV